MANIGPTLSKYVSTSELSNLLESDKFGVVSVESYGAVGDGVTDDTAAFLAALADIYSSSRFNRNLFLVSGKTYLVSDELPINNDLCIYSLGNGKAFLKNITTDMFYVPAANTTNNRIYSYKFYNIEFEGANTTSFMQSDSYQHWLTKIEKCTFKGFLSVFEDISIYASVYIDNNASDILSLGTIGGSDNIIDKFLATGVDTSVVKLLTLDALYLTDITNCFLTGGLTSGCTNIIYAYRCRGLNIQNNWFDYSDSSGLYVQESYFCNIKDNTFRGNCRTEANDGMFNLKGSNNILFEHNKFLNVHQGSQNATARAYRIFDYVDFESDNIIVQNNFFEIDYYTSISFQAGTYIDGLIIREPSQNINLSSLEKVYTATWNPGDLADGVGETSSSITATGAALGDFVIVSAPYDLQGITCNGYVDATNSVKIRLQNETGGNINLADGTWKVKVIKA